MQGPLDGSGWSSTQGHSGAESGTDLPRRTGVVQWLAMSPRKKGRPSGCPCAQELVDLAVCPDL